MLKKLLAGLMVMAGIALACPATLFTLQYLRGVDPYSQQRAANDYADSVAWSARFNAFWDTVFGGVALLFAWLPFIIVGVIIFVLWQRSAYNSARRRDMLNRPIEGMFPLIETDAVSPLHKLWLILTFKPVPKHLVNANTAGAIVTVGQPTPVQRLAAADAQSDLLLRSRFMGVQGQIGQQRRPTSAEVKAQIGAKGYTPWLGDIGGQRALPQPDDEDEAPQQIQPISWGEALAQTEDGHIPLGWSPTEGEIATWNYLKDPHLTILGKSGTGKSLRVGLPVVLGWLHRGNPAIVLDPEGGASFSAVDRWALVAPLDTNDSSVNPTLWDKLEAEFERRRAYVDAAGQSNYVLTDLPPLGIFFEEFQQYHERMESSDPALAKKMVGVLARIAKGGRKYGLHLVLWGQQSDQMPRAVLFNDTSLTLAQSTKAAQVMSVYPAACELKQGEFLYDHEVYSSWRIVRFKGEEGGVPYGRVRITEEDARVMAQIPDSRAYFTDSPLLQIELLSNQSGSTPHPAGQRSFASLGNRQQTLYVPPPTPAPVAQEPQVPLEPDTPRFNGPWLALTEEWYRQHPDRLYTYQLQRGDISELAEWIFVEDGGRLEDYPTKTAAIAGKKSTASEHIYAVLDRAAVDEEYRNSLLS